MKRMLVLLPGLTPLMPVQWALIAGGKVLRSASCPCVHDLDIPDACGPDVVTLFVLPGEQVAMRSLAVPPGTRKKFRAAAALLMEDELAESPDNLHITVIARPDGAGFAFGVKRVLMDSWMDALAAAGIVPDVMYPDFFLLPFTDTGAFVLCDRDRIAGVCNLQGFALERPMADEITRMLVEQEEPEHVTVLVCPGTNPPVLPDREIDWQEIADIYDLLVLYAHGVQPDCGAGLLQGTYRRRRDWSGLFRPWARAAMLAAACLVAGITAVIADGFRARHFAGLLEQDTLKLHREAFPGMETQSPRRHARQLLSSGTRAPAFQELSALLAESLEAVEGIQVDRIRYNKDKGIYSASLQFLDINDLDLLTRRLEAHGIASFQQGSARRKGNVFIGEIRMRL